MNIPMLRSLALPAITLLGLASVSAHAVTITEDFNSYTASETPVTGLTSAPGFGSASNGWLTGWRSASSTTPASASILNSSPLNGGGNYLSGTLTSNSTTGTPDGIALTKAYDVTGNSLASASALYYNFDFRTDALPSSMRFDIFDNRTRGSGADGSNTSWHMRAAGGFWYVLNGGSVVATNLAATTGVTYSISVVSDPTNSTWSYTIDNGTTSVSGSGLGFRNASFGTDSTSGSVGGRWFGVSAAEITDLSAQSGTFSIDNISISTTPIPEPSTIALLGGFFALGAAATRRRR